MATYKVRLINEAEGLDTTINVDDDVYILDAAEEEGIRPLAKVAAGVLSGVKLCDRSASIIRIAYSNCRES
jgi:hypothetical protein